MAQTYRFRSESSAVIPVSDSSWIVDGVSLDYNQHELAIRFYSDESRSSIAIPSAGTITIQYSLGGAIDVWRNFSNGSAISASGCLDSSWTPPSSMGSAEKFKLTLNGVTGAGHFTAWVISK